MSSLAERFAKLADTAPVFHDPEDDINTETAARVIEPFETDGNEDFISNLRKKTVPALSDVDSRYAGKKVSRKSYETSGDDDQASSSSGSSDNENISSFKKQFQRTKNINENLEVKMDVDNDSEKDDQSEDEDDQTEDEDDQTEDEDDQTDDEDDEDVNDDASAGDDVIQNFSKIDLNKEMERGKAVQAQLAFWDKLLELRIKLQKLLVLANKLPQPESWPALKATGNDLLKPLTKGKKKMKKVLGSLVELQDSVLSQNPETANLFDGTPKSKQPLTEENEEIPSDTEDEIKKPELKMTKSKRVKRKLADSEYPDFLEKRHRDFIPYRNGVIQRWNEKTRVASGKLNQKSFSAFEQSALKQIEQILTDKERLRKRTQLKRTVYKVLGSSQTKKSDPDNSIETENESLLPKQSDHMKDYDSEIFDDSDFYHQLLRELIERKTADVTDPVALSRQWLEIQKLRSKMKRKVDTKASKGRKIRYDVMPKLVSLMAPVDTSTNTDEAKDELFSCMFGQRNNNYVKQHNKELTK